MTTNMKALEEYCEDGISPSSKPADCKSAGTGSIRHAFQNRFAHDSLTHGQALWFLPLDIKPTGYFYYGTGTGNTLW